MSKMEHWTETWRRLGDDMPCPNCGQRRLKSQDGITACDACPWSADNPVMREAYEEDEEQADSGKQTWRFDVIVQFDQFATEDDFEYVFQSLVDAMRRQYAEGVSNPETEPAVQGILIRSELHAEEVIGEI